MAKFKSEDLLNELAEDVRKIRAAAEYFRDVDKTKMVYCPDKGKWSIIQVFEHLNAFCRHYLPEIEKQLSVITHGHSPWFNSGFWGEKFTNSMKPKNVYEITNKMKTMKRFTFPNSLNVDTVMNEFMQHQDKLQSLLELAKKRDLNKIRIPLSISSLVKFRLGDVFRFLVAHEQRHLIQARNTLKAIGIATDKFPVILQAVPQ